jgi:hypothetical protein
MLPWSYNRQSEGALVPYFKCAPCRIRLARESPEVALFYGLCPVCGLELEQATELAELVGFRAFDLAQGDRAFATPTSGQEQFVGRVLAAMTRRDATPADTQLDAGRWIDDGGSLGSEAVARRLPPTS